MTANTNWSANTPQVQNSDYGNADFPVRVWNPAAPSDGTQDVLKRMPVLNILAMISGALASATVGLFNAIGTATPSAAAIATAVGGYSINGVGPSVIVADSVATSALAAAHPTFCKADASGRYWRIAPTDGKILISQGGALGGTNNDQPAVQAAISYAQAIGCRELLWDFDTVSLWTPGRTSAASGDPAAFNSDGQAVWVTAPIKFTGLPTQTHIKLLSPTGQSLETNVQNVGGAAWRGSGINLVGGTKATPNAYGFSFFAMENIWLDGGCQYTGSRATPTPGSPDGADLTNKGIRLQDTECDNILLTNCVISGFKGEAYYVAGTTSTVQTLRNVTISGSNQSAFNPSSGPVWAENCSFGNSFLAVESLGGPGGRYNNCRFYDSQQVSITGGPANGVLYNYGYPTRDTTKAPPWIDLIGCDFHNAGQLLVGNYIRMLGCRATDVFLTLNTAVTIGALTSTYIDLVYTIDQSSGGTIVTLSGPPTLTTLIPGATGSNYVLSVDDVHVRLSVRRTTAARNAGRYMVAFAVGGYINQDTCSLELNEADGIAEICNNAGAGTLEALPLITATTPTTSQTIGAQNYFGINGPQILTMTAGPYAIAPIAPRHGLQNTGTGAAIACTMAAPFTAPYNFANGQKLRLYYWPGSASGTTYTFAHNGTGLRLNSDCTLAANYDYLDLEFSAALGLWVETGRSIHAA